MQVQIKTIVTTTIDVETMQPSHDVELDFEKADPLPVNVCLAAAVGGVKSAQKVIEEAMGQYT